MQSLPYTCLKRALHPPLLGHCLLPRSVVSPLSPYPSPSPGHLLLLHCPRQPPETRVLSLGASPSLVTAPALPTAASRLRAGPGSHALLTRGGTTKVFPGIQVVLGLAS